MASASSQESKILFPWERRRKLRRWLGLGRLRPFLVLGGIVVATVAIGSYEHRSAGVRQTRASLLGARHAVDTFIADHDGGCPGGVDEAAGYSRVEPVPHDAWGKPFRLTCPGRSPSTAYDLMSDGPDGKPGGLDRIE